VPAMISTPVLKIPENIWYSVTMIFEVSGGMNDRFLLPGIVWAIAFGTRAFVVVFTRRDFGSRSVCVFLAASTCILASVACSSKVSKEEHRTL